MKTAIEIRDVVQAAISELSLREYELHADYSSWSDKCLIRGHMVGTEIEVNGDNFDQVIYCINNGKSNDLAYRLTLEKPTSGMFGKNGGEDKSYYTPSNGWYYKYEGETTVVSVMGGNFIGYARGSNIEWVKQ